uniref:Uncharacterized protein n=1 Tax=Streptomyces sp. FR1 TaxID=349971 RepID=V9Z3U6_9ACTN|nr:hypothetical protein pFRL3_11 [Streptomyces sp. FR1]
MNRLQLHSSISCSNSSDSACRRNIPPSVRPGSRGAPGRTGVRRARPRTGPSPLRTVLRRDSRPLPATERRMP